MDRHSQSWTFPRLISSCSLTMIQRNTLSSIRRRDYFNTLDFLSASPQHLAYSSGLWRVFSKVFLESSYTLTISSSLEQLKLTTSMHLNKSLIDWRKQGYALRKKKCQFMVQSVAYLGYKIDAEGIHLLAEKVHAVADAPQPKNTQELKSYLGLLSYYSKFMPSLSTVLGPLYRLLKKDVRWKWSSAEEKSFQKSKELLTSTKVLVHFNPKHKLVLACDTSAYGIKAVLAHKFLDGSERPIAYAYASRSHAPSEKNYSQLEKEGLAYIFGVKRFHSICMDTHSNHKPLLGEHRPTSPQSSARIKQWSLPLSAFVAPKLIRMLMH